MKKYKLGIVFSGGGSKAAAHCGALQALKEFGIEADVLAGTSAGSLVAAFHSAGLSPSEMISMLSGMNFFQDVVTPSVPRGGFFDSTPLVNLIHDLLPYKNFEELPIPVYVAASDMDNGKTVIFSKGELAPRLVASCSIPVIFQPMVIDGVHYIDGGVFMNLPVTPLREMCRKIISISVRHVGADPYKDNIIHVASRAYQMMFMANLIDDAKLSDLNIDLDTTGYSVYDISNAEELFFLGYKDACAALEAAGYKRKLPAEKIVFTHKEKQSLFQKYRDHFIDLIQDALR